MWAFGPLVTEVLVKDDAGGRLNIEINRYTIVWYIIVWYRVIMWYSMV